MIETFARLMPDAEASQFLRACIDPSEAGRTAWQSWRSQHVLRDEIERNGTGYKRLLPLLAYTLEQGGVAPEADDLNLLRAARMREQLRAEKIRVILRQALNALAQANIDVRLLKGAAISQSVYPTPDLRHTHDLDFLVRPAEQTRAADALRAVGFQVEPTPPRVFGNDVRLVHPNGLPLVLHTTLFQSSAYTLPDDEIWDKPMSLDIDSASARSFSSELLLVHLLGQTFFTSAREMRMWVSDAYFLVQRSPAFDWDRAADKAIRARLALPVYLMLDYLHRELGLGMPIPTLEALQTAASKTTQAEYESALTMLRSNRQGGYRHWLKNAANPHEKLQVARWVLRSYNKR